MIHERKLFSRLDKVKSGDEFVGCNLAQAVPGVKIFAGRKGLKFTRCNLARAIVPSGSDIVDCNTSQAPIPEHVEPEETVEITKKEYDRLKAAEVSRG